MTDDSLSVPRSVLGRVLDLLWPVWQQAFRDPVRDGHLRLEGLTRPAHQLATVGLVTLGLLLLSVVFNDVWRAGDLLPLGGTAGSLSFLPLALLPVTLLCFLIAWSLLLWGAAGSSAGVRVGLAILFLLTNASFGVPSSIEVGDALALQIGPTLIRVGYFAAPALLLASITLVRSATWARRLAPWIKLGMLTSAGLVFLTHLWVHITFVAEGFPGGAQSLVGGAITEIEGVLLPLVFVSGILVIDFSLDVAEGVARSARRATALVAKLLLSAVLATKLAIQVLAHLPEWGLYVRSRPVAVVRTIVALALLTLAVAVIARMEDRGDFDPAKERLIYGSGVVLALGYILTVLVVGAGLFVLAQFDTDEIPAFVNAFPGEALNSYGRPVLAAVAIVVGLFLIRRNRRPVDREVGSGMFLVGAWLLPIFLLDLSTTQLGFSDTLFDAGASAAIALYLLARWRHIDTARAVSLGAVTVFVWLVMTRGDWISILGGFAGLPTVFLVVVGILFSVAADAGFTRTGSRRLPQATRPLLFIGYLVLSVTILNWILATHVVNDQGANADAGFFYLGMPLAAWLVARRIVRPEASAAEDSHHAHSEAEQE